MITLSLQFYKNWIIFSQFSLYCKNYMKKHLCVRWLVVMFSSMFLCLLFAFIGAHMGVTTFARSAPLSSLMKAFEFFISGVILLLIIFLVAFPFFLGNFFQHNWIKRWKAFLPIDNIRILLWIIGIETKSFFAFSLWMIVWIMLLLLQPRYQCPCYGYGEFLASVFLFSLCAYSLWFMIFVFYRLHKYNSDREKINNKSN